MSAQSLLKEAWERGLTLKVEGDRLLYHPTSAASADFIHSLRQHKSQVIKLLTEGTGESCNPPKGYCLKYPDAQATNNELEEIAQRVDSGGYVLLWSKELTDLVAFYRDEGAKSEIPPGFVPYSVKELGELFGTNPISGHELRLIHEAKKHGGHVISRENKECH